MDTQYTMLYLNLGTISSVENFLPSKHLMFLSFQMVQMVAMKEDRHKILPLEDPIASFQVSNNSPIFLGKTQQQMKTLKDWISHLHSYLTI